MAFNDYTLNEARAEEFLDMLRDCDVVVDEDWPCDCGSVKFYEAPGDEETLYYCEACEASQ